MAISNQIIGGAFQDAAGNPLANGILVFELSQDEQSPIPGQIGASRKIQVSLDSTGNVPASPAVFVWANDSLNPLNSYYIVTAYSSVGQRVWGPQSQQVLSSPSPFNLSNWVPGSINLSATPAPTILLQTNGTKNGSQTKFNAVAGSGMTITDDGSGDITFAASGGSASGSLSISSAVASGSVNLTTQGSYDWLMVSPNNDATSYFNPVAWRWKTFNGELARTFRFLASAAGVSTEGGTSGGAVAFSASSGDDGADTSENFASPGGNPLTNVSSWRGVFANAGVTGYGFQFSCQSNSQARTLKLYLKLAPAVGQVGIKVTAHLLDGSAADVTQSLATVGTTPQSNVLTINFNSATASRLIVTALVNINAGTNGEIQFLGATVS